MITRRHFLVAASALAGGSALASNGVLARGRILTSGASANVSAAGARLAPTSPVVAYFDGQLWLDTSGASIAYRPPTAMPAVPSFTDEELTRARGYI